MYVLHHNRYPFVTLFPFSKVVLILHLFLQSSRYSLIFLTSPFMASMKIETKISFESTIKQAERCLLYISTALDEKEMAKAVELLTSTASATRESQNLFSEFGVIDFLLPSLSGTCSIDLKIQVVGALSALSLNNQRNQSLIYMKNGIRPLIALLSDEKVSLLGQCFVMYSLCNIADRNTEICRLICEEMVDGHCGAKKLVVYLEKDNDRAKCSAASLIGKGEGRKGVFALPSISCCFHPSTHPWIYTL